MTELNIILEEGFNQIFGDIMDNPVLKEIEKENNKND